MARKSSLLPVEPGARTGGCRSQTPVPGMASSTAKLPRLVSMTVRRTQSGRRRDVGVLTVGDPYRAELYSSPCWIDERGSICEPSNHASMTAGLQTYIGRPAQKFSAEDLSRGISAG